MAVATSRNILSVIDGSPIRENTINPEVDHNAPTRPRLQARRSRAIDTRR